MALGFVLLLTLTISPTVRSEGGAECRKIQKEMRPNGEEAPEASDASTSSSSLKPDPDANWSGGSIVM